MTNDLTNRYNDLFDHMGDWLDKLDSHAIRTLD
jgi:HSP20 family protein